MTSAAAQPTVLVVEDEPDVREAVAELLEWKGYTVVTASNGQEALQALAAMERPALVLLDLMMPVMDGYAFVERLRATGVLPTLPVLVVTANRDAVAPPGTVGLLRKPTALDELLAEVARYCPLA